MTLGKAPSSSLGSLPAPRLSLGDVKGSYRVWTGLELKEVSGSIPVGNSCSLSPRPLSEAQDQIKGTQH